MSAERLLDTIDRDPAYAWAQNEQNAGALKLLLADLHKKLAADPAMNALMLRDSKAVQRSVTAERWPTILCEFAALAGPVKALMAQTKRILQMHAAQGA